jgi:hypothetical protein
MTRAPFSSTTRLGPYRLTAQLAKDGFGTLHRAVRAEAGAFVRHALVRRFDPALLARGLRETMGQSVQISLRVGEARGLAPHCRIYHSQEEPWIAYDLAPGLTLADLIAACRSQGRSLGLDQVLPVIRDLAEVLDHLHQRGLDHGLLVPQLVWVSYEGAITVLDVPVFQGVRAALAKHPMPGLEALQWAPADGAARDLHLLGVLGWQMLTLEPHIPQEPSAMMAALETASASQGMVITGPLRQLFARMVGLAPRFADLESFLVESGKVMHQEDYAPSTFNLAFLLHTLFHERIAEEEKRMDAERAAVWTISQAVPVVAAAKAPLPSRRPRWKPALVGLSALAVAVSVGIVMRRRGHGETEALRTELALAQRHRAEVVQAQADLDVALAQEKERRQRWEQERAEAKDALQQEQLRRAVEEVQAQQLELQARVKKARADAERAEAQARLLQMKSDSKNKVVIPSPSAPPISPQPTVATAPPASSSSLVMGSSPAKLLQQAPAKVGLGAKVRVRVFVSESGRPLRATVVEGPGGAINDAAVDTALASTFQSAYREGHPVRDWVDVVLTLK